MLVFEHVHGNLVELDFVDGLDDLELDLNGLTECGTSSVHEVVLGCVLFSIGNGARLDLDRNEHVECGHLVYEKVDWKDEFLEWVRILSIEDALEGESFLPWPVGVVLYDDLYHAGLSRVALEDFWWDSDSKGSVFLPFTVATTTFPVASLATVSTHEVFHEFTGHLTDAFKVLLSSIGTLVEWESVAEWMLASFAPSAASVATTMSSSVATVVITMMMTMSVISEECWILIDVLLDIGSSIGHLFINHGKNSFWSLTWILNLQEWMVMLSSFLTV